VPWLLLACGCCCLLRASNQGTKYYRTVDEVGMKMTRARGASIDQSRLLPPPLLLLLRLRPCPLHPAAPWLSLLKPCVVCGVDESGQRGGLQPLGHVSRRRRRRVWICCGCCCGAASVSVAVRSRRRSHPATASRANKSIRATIDRVIDWIRSSRRGAGGGARASGGSGRRRKGQ
jgi:hypothetical protein